MIVSFLSTNRKLNFGEEQNSCYNPAILTQAAFSVIMNIKKPQNKITECSTASAFKILQGTFFFIKWLLKSIYVAVMEARSN